MIEISLEELKAKILEKNKWVLIEPSGQITTSDNPEDIILKLLKSEEKVEMAPA